MGDDEPFYNLFDSTRDEQMKQEKLKKLQEFLVYVEFLQAEEKGASSHELEYMTAVSITDDLRDSKFTDKKGEEIKRLVRKELVSKTHTMNDLPEDPAFGFYSYPQYPEPQDTPEESIEYGRRLYDGKIVPIMPFASAVHRVENALFGTFTMFELAVILFAFVFVVGIIIGKRITMGVTGANKTTTETRAPVVLFTPITTGEAIEYHE